MAEKRGAYKFCLVPKCNSTTVATPNKYFFPVPRDKKWRTKWCKAMKRDNGETLSCKTSLHCCEDHFDIGEDVENLVKYKLVGGKMILKSGVLPHKFDYQHISKKIKRRPEKRHKAKNVSAKNIRHQPIEFVSCGTNTTEEITESSDSTTLPTEELVPLKPNIENKGIQVSIRTKKNDKMCQTIIPTLPSLKIEPKEELDDIEIDFSVPSCSTIFK